MGCSRQIFMETELTFSINGKVNDGLRTQLRFVVGRGLAPAENTRKICIVNLFIIIPFIYRQNNLLVVAFRQEQAPALRRCRTSNL